MQNYRYTLLFISCLFFLHTHMLSFTITHITNKSSQSIYVDQIDANIAQELETNIIPNLMFHMSEKSSTSFEVNPSTTPTKIVHLTLLQQQPVYISTSHYMYKLFIEESQLYAHILFTIKEPEYNNISEVNFGEINDNTIIITIDTKERLSIVEDDSLGN